MRGYVPGPYGKETLRLKVNTSELGPLEKSVHRTTRSAGELIPTGTQSAKIIPNSDA